MPTYLIEKDNKLAIAFIERILAANEAGDSPFVLCSKEELNEFNKNVIVLPNKEVNQCECSSLLLSNRLQQAQREYNLKVSQMVESAALGIPCYDTIQNTKKYWFDKYSKK